MTSQPAPRIRLSRASTSFSEEDQHVYHDRSEVTATEEELWLTLSPEHLMMLRRYFIQPRGWSGRGSLSIAGEDEAETRLLTRPQLIDAFTTILDTEKFEGACGIMFDAISATNTSSVISTTASSGLTGAPISSSSSNISSSSSSIGGSSATVGISWGNLITYLATGVSGLGREAPPDPLFSPTAKYSLLTQNKREGVAGVVVCGRKRILIVGARGSLTKTLHRSRQQHHARLNLDSSPDDQIHPSFSASRKTSLGTWIVEVSMVEEEMAVMAASSSTLHFVDTSNSVPQEILRITHLPALPTCIAAGRMTDGRWVCIGDDTGTVHLIRFSHSIVTLLTRSRNEGLTFITWQEMCNGLKEINGRIVEVCVGVRVVTLPNVHSGSVRQVTYHQPYSSLVSCSSDSKASLVIRGPDHATKTYTFSIPKGVRVFAAEWQMHIIVTGSSDGRLRVWNPYVPEAPLAVLPPSPSRAPPAAVLIWSLRRTILACDADAVVRVYGLDGSRCIQTIKLSFPGGSNGLALRPLTLLPTDYLIVACRDYLATLSPAPRSLSTPHHPHPTEITASHSDLSSDGESDNGLQENGDDESQLGKDGESSSSSEESEEEKDDLNKVPLLSSEERQESQRMRRLVRQGATFCCLKLHDVSPPTLPPDLPLPPRLANLGLSPSDPIALLAHLQVSPQAVMQTPRSAPASARSPSSRLRTPTPKATPRPKSGRRAPKSPRTAPITSNQPEALGSRRHLSPGWRPQQSNFK